MANRVFVEAFKLATPITTGPVEFIWVCTLPKISTDQFQIDARGVPVRAKAMLRHGDQPTACVAPVTRPQCHDLTGQQKWIANRGDPPGAQIIVLACQTRDTHPLGMGLCFNPVIQLQRVTGGDARILGCGGQRFFAAGMQIPSHGLGVELMGGLAESVACDRIAFDQVKPAHWGCALDRRAGGKDQLVSLDREIAPPFFSQPGQKPQVTLFVLRDALKTQVGDFTDDGETVALGDLGDDSRMGTRA